MARKLESEKTSKVQEESNASAMEALSQLKDLFATLVPPETLELQDAFGNTHLTRSTLPARAQIKVMQQLEKLWKLELDGAIGGDLTGVAGVSNLLMSLASNEDVLDSLSKAFACAHPAAMKTAKMSALDLNMLESECSHAADLFPVEEIIAGLLPFFMRLANRAMELMDKMTSQPQLRAVS
jgi:hypothetical protein